MDLPTLNVSGKGIAEAWENSVVKLYNNGLWYNRNGPKDKGESQVDSTMLIEIKEADQHPFYHRFSNCGWEDLLEYSFEIMGAKNFLTVNEFDLENDDRWPYQYSDRMLNYPARSGDINQIENIVNKLSEKPHTRGGSIGIWVPDQDIVSKDPPCLQHMWFGLIPDGNGNYDLNMNYMFRSRNVMIAAPMNMFGLYIIQNYVKDKLNEKLNSKVCNGRIVDYNNSYHVSSRDVEKLSNFINRFEKTKGNNIETRVFSREDTFSMMKDCFNEVEERIKKLLEDRFEERIKLEKNKDKVRQEILESNFRKGIKDTNEISQYLRKFIEKC